jgi:hypothetical protein
LTEPSGWRVNDVVGYDVMRESAVALATLLIRETRTTSEPDRARGELAQLRQDVLTVDAFDRAAVAALAARLEDRTRKLSEELS